MLSGIEASLSGIRAALTRMGVSAHHVANLTTHGFKKDLVRASEGPSGGVVIRLDKSTEPGPRYRASDGTLIESSNVDLAEEAVQQLIAKHGLGANLAAFQTADAMQKTIIDLFA